MRVLQALMVVAGLFWAYAAPASAEGEVAACVESAGDEGDALAACQGVVANPCLETDGGASTQGMVMCFAAEADAWASELHAALTRLAAARPETDAALTSAQDAWSDYRDSECAYRVARWGEGSGARVVLAQCLAQLTALRAIDLIAYEREGD